MVRTIDIIGSGKKTPASKGFARRDARGQRKLLRDDRTLFRRLITVHKERALTFTAWNAAHPGKSRTLTLACKSYLRKVCKSIAGIKLAR